MAKGRYEKWITDDGLLLIQGWARKGLSNKQIAQNIGISEQTLYDWDKRFPEFSECLKKTKEVTVYEVENALYKSALGYYVDEQKVTISDKDGEKVEKIHRYIPPNPTAQIFYLKNKDPENWQEKKEVAVESNGVLESILALRNNSINDKVER